MKQIVLFCIVMLGLFAGLNAQTPVARYALNGNTRDLSVHQNDASANAVQLVKDRFGWPKQAAHFDGIQSSLTAPSAAHLNTEKASVAFWVKVESLPAQGEVFLLSYGGWQERFKISLPAHGKAVWTTNHSGGISDMDAGDANALVPGVWTHLVMVHDGAQDLIYVNGVVANTKAVVGTLNSTTHPLGIGYDPIDGVNFFKGDLDEVTLYDLALSAQEVLALYTTQNQTPVVEPGLVASYSLDGSGSDDSDFNNDAVGIDLTSTTNRFGYGNSAMQFNGTSSELLAANAAYLNSPATTVSMWVKVNVLPANGESFLLSNGGWQERLKISLPSHGKPVFTTNYSGGISDMDAGEGNALQAGKWTHVVMVHDGAWDKIFFDGVEKASKAVAGTLNATTHPLGIGFNAIDGGNWFDGAMDDVQIYNFAMNNAGVKDLFDDQSAFPGVETDLVASYSLDGDGADATQYNNDAVLNAGAIGQKNRHGWASNALSGGAVAANSAALQSDFTTISFWVNANTLPASGEVFLLSNGGWQERWKISLPPHGKPVFTTHPGFCCSDMDSGDGNALVPGVWKHVAMVHDGTEDKIYMDGVLVNSKNVAGPLDKTTKPFGIGFDPIDVAGYFDGSLDDILIYNKALSAAEILALYDAQKIVPVVDGALIADYTFAGSTTDATDYKNHANGAGFQFGKDRFGKSNKAVVFDGVSDFLKAENSPQHNSPNVSVSFWAKPNALPASGEVYLLSNGGWQERWKISLPSHGKVVFTTHTTTCCNDIDAGAGNELVVGKWSHVVMTHDGTNDVIYVDGVMANQKPYAGALGTTTHPLGIGYDPIDNNNFFNGSLDEVQIYSEALSALDVAALFALQSLPPTDEDAEAPASPLNLSAQVQNTTIDLSWNLATDNVAVTAYNVYQNGEQIATVPSNEISISDLLPLTEFIFGVSAVDAAGNESTITTLAVTSGDEASPDTTPPTDPGNLRGQPGSTSVIISWDPSTDDRKLQGYVVLLDGVFLDSLDATTTTKLVTDLQSLTLYSFEVYAFDLAGNSSGLSEVTLSTTAPLVTAEPGLVAHYPFEGNANDATPYNNHGVIGGNPVFESSTHSDGGMCLKFDGNGDSVLVANSVQMLSDFTSVSFWIRVDGTNLADAESYVIDFGHWDQRFKISLPQHLKIVFTTNGNNAQFPNFISDMDSGDGNEMVKTFWWNVVMVHDGEKDLIYVNGFKANEKPVPTALNSTNRPMCFASNPIEGGQYFNGALDEIKIYNKALTAAEIEKLFTSGTTGINETKDLSKYDVKVFPNPVVDQVNINHNFGAKESIRVRIFDLLGRQVGQEILRGNQINQDQITINTQHYKAGMYILNFVIDDKEVGSTNFIK